MTDLFASATPSNATIYISSKQQGIVMVWTTGGQPRGFITLQAAEEFARREVAKRRKLGYVARVRVERSGGEWVDLT